MNCPQKSGAVHFCVKNPAAGLIDTVCAVKIFRILEHRRSLKIIHLASGLALQEIGVVKFDKKWAKIMGGEEKAKAL